MKHRAAKTTLTIEDGEVKANVIPEETVQVESVEALPGEKAGKPRIRFTTPEGEAVYEYCGDCWDCKDRDGETLPVFKCVSGKIRANEQIGNQLACFINDGVALPVCQRHYKMRLGNNPQAEPLYKVIEKRW